MPGIEEDIDVVGLLLDAANADGQRPDVRAEGFEQCRHGAAAEMNEGAVPKGRVSWGMASRAGSCRAP